MQRLAAAGLLVACVVSSGCKRHDAPHAVPSGAIVWSDAGRATLVVGTRALSLPHGDLRPGATPTVARDEAGTRYSYATADDRVRVVYALGTGLYPAAIAESPEHAPRAPRVEEALGALFDVAGERRGELVSDVRQALGEDGLVRLLVGGADAVAPEWDAALASLSPARADDVRRALVATLGPGKPTVGMRRAVMIAPLAEAARLPAFAERVAERAAQDAAPRAVSAMLRALASVDAARAGELGCDVLRRPAQASGSKGGSPASTDERGRAILVEAAALAIAHAGTDCAAVEVALGDDMCTPVVRCGPQGPLTGREASSQDEPTCTKDELLGVIAAELGRPASEVVAGAAGTRAPLFALAALVAGRGLPGAFGKAHARRRYALVQPKEPACEGASPGTRCHCDEAVVRDAACRSADGGRVQVGVCAFDVDDAGKRLTNVVAASPP